MNYLALLWLIATLLLPCTPLAAQEDCLGFENFPTGPLFGQGVGDSPGDTVLQRDNYDVLIQPILYLNGNTGFMTASVQEEGNLPWLPGKFLLQGNNVLDFRFSQSVSKICFDFFDGGGEENFAVNGSEVFVLDKLSELSDLDLPGIEIETQLDSSSSGLLRGTICLSGDIASFRIGGQEFGLDNICTQTLPEGCIGFEGLEEASYGEGDTPPGQVFYEEAEVPMRLAPVRTLFWTNTYNQLKVLDAPQQPDFSNALGQYLNFDGISTVFDLSQYPEPVEKVQVDFFYKNEVDGTVNFAANGSEVLLLFNLMPGLYDLAPGVQLEVVFEENSLNEGQLIFTGDNLQALLIGGLSDLSIDNFCINPQPPCPIENFTVEASDCNPNNVFDVTIDFDYAGSPDDTIKLYTNGNYQPYAAGDFPLTLEPFIAPTDSILFEAEQWNTTGCTVAAVLPPQDCGEDCPLQEAEVVGTPACSNTNGTVYQAILELPGANLPGDTVVVASQLTGEVAYGVLDPNEGDTFDFSLPNTNELYDLVTVCLLGQPDCCVEVDYDILCPPLCEIEAEFLGGPECLAAGGYLVAFSVPDAEAGDELLVSSQETGQSTTVIYDGQWAEVDFPLPPDGFDKLEICLAEAGELCCAYLEFDLPCTDQCDIQEWAIEPEACNEEGEFALYVDLLYEGIPTSFNLSIPELGFEEVYAAGDFPLEIPGLPGDGATYELRIAATDCNEVVEELVDFPNCSPGCTFEQVIAEPHPCEDGEFLVDIEVQANEPGALGYYIFADGDIFGPYDYSETFITLGPFAGDGETVYDFLILDIEDPACFGYAEVGPKDCEAEGCDITELAVEPSCSSNGIYELWVDLETENPGNDFVEFYLDNTYLGYYEIDALPLVLDSLPQSSSGQAVLQACINDQPNCCAEVEYTVPNCEDECSISGVEASFAYCDSLGFYVELSFEAEGVASNGLYRILGNGQVYDTLAYGDPFPLIGPFDPFTGNLYELAVEDLQQPDCGGFVEFPALDCTSGGCLDFEAFAGFVSTSNTGGQGEVEIGSDAGVQFNYAIADFCNCQVEVVDSNSTALFDAGQGAMVDFQQAELIFAFNEPAGFASFDYALQSSTITYRGGNAATSVVALDTLPFNEEVLLSDGNTIEIVPYSNDPSGGNSGKAIIRGAFEELRLFGDGLIDNLCWEPANQEVWPGDANADNIAHHIDLLNIGLAYGAEGPERFVDGTGWMPAVAPNWDSTFADGTNYKHTDCNGDGIIDSEDRAAILENYGLEHAEPEPVTELPGTEIDPPAFIDAPFGLPNGASFELPVVVGTEELPVEDAYGIAFTVEYDPEVLDPNSIELAYPASWFGEPGVNAITVHKVYSEGQIEVALSRTDHNNVSGHGPVVYIIGIIDDIAGLTKSRVEIKEVYAINQSEGRLPVQGLDTEFEIRVSSTNQEELDGAFSLFPNPTSDWVNIRSTHGFQIDALRLLSIDGREVPIRTQDANQRLSLEGLPPGAYLLQIVSGKAAVQKRIIKQ